MSDLPTDLVAGDPDHIAHHNALHARYNESGTSLAYSTFAFAFDTPGIAAGVDTGIVIPADTIIPNALLFCDVLTTFDGGGNIQLGTSADEVVNNAFVNFASFVSGNDIDGGRVLGPCGNPNNPVYGTRFDADAHLWLAYLFSSGDTEGAAVLYVPTPIPLA